jgi:hypothetical protein
LGSSDWHPSFLYFCFLFEHLLCAGHCSRSLVYKDKYDIALARRSLWSTKLRQACKQISLRKDGWTGTVTLEHLLSGVEGWVWGLDQERCH